MALQQTFYIILVDSHLLEQNDLTDHLFLDAILFVLGLLLGGCFVAFFNLC